MTDIEGLVANAGGPRPTTHWRLEHLKITRRAGAIARFHTLRVRPQSIAEHCYGVVEIILAIREVPGHALLVAALRHDVYEIFTGDTPAPAKWAHAPLRDALDGFEEELNAVHQLIPALEERDALLLKWADMAELVLFACEERKAGNHHARELLDNGWRALKKFPIHTGDALGVATVSDFIYQEVQLWTK